MMSLVVDTSVIISVVTNEIHKEKLIKLTTDEELVAPSSLHFELVNAFSAMFKRNRISLELANLALKYYGMIPIRLLDVDMEKALAISFENNIYAYDAYFLECAIRYKARLISLDNGLLYTAQKLGLEIIEV